MDLVILHFCSLWLVCRLSPIFVLLYRSRVVSPVSRFARESFRPWVVSPVGPFALGRFALSRFARGSFRPYLVGRFALVFLLKHQGLSQAMFGDIYGGLDFPTIIFRWVRVWGGGGGRGPDSYRRKPLTHEERAPFHSPATRRHMSRHTR